MSNAVEFALKHGNEFPFDAPDKWADHFGSPPPKDWACSAARAVIANLW